MLSYGSIIAHFVKNVNILCDIISNIAQFPEVLNESTNSRQKKMVSALFIKKIKAYLEYGSCKTRIIRSIRGLPPTSTSTATDDPVPVVGTTE